MARLPLLLLLLAAGAMPAAHADYDAAMAAYQSRDYETALAEFRALAEKGVVLAQTNLGYMYTLGEGVERDLAEAAKWFRMAAEAGSSAAQVTVGALAYHGEGVARDPVDAYAWFSVAAAAGQDSAEVYLVVLTGQLSSEELAEARTRSERYYREFGRPRSVSLGDPKAPAQE